MTTTAAAALSSLAFVVALSCLVAPSSCVQPDPETRALIERVCDRTVDRKTCEYVLTRNISSPRTNIVDLTKLTVGIALDLAQSTATSIKQLGDALVRNPVEKRVNEQCQQAYERVVSNLKIAKMWTDLGDFQSMAGYMLLCAKPISFAENHIGSQIGEETKKLKLLISTALYEKAEMHGLRK